MLRRAAEWLALTRNEKRVILFLVCTLLVGAGIRYYQYAFPAPSRFDYRVPDSTFSSLSSAEAAEAGSDSLKETAGVLNINTATKQELMELPGIGEVIASRIIHYRRESGTFSSVEDLRAIKGMSGKKLERLKPLITTQ
jgi:competence ComEA-like helix-hairpin-helix protein